MSHKYGSSNPNQKTLQLTRPTIKKTVSLKIPICPFLSGNPTKQTCSEIYVNENPDKIKSFIAGWWEV